MSLPKHGANPKYIYEKLELEMPETILDFSVNLNPLGPPKKIFNRWKELKKEIINYPDPNGQKLKKLIALKEKIDSKNVLLGNGAAELIQLIAIYFKDKKIGLFQPTFSEYKRMTEAYNAKITNLSINKLEDINYLKKITKEQDALFLCQPNNPSGEIYERIVLENLLNTCEDNQCMLILDEAFYDFTKEKITMIDYIEKSDYLLILRSVTKMFSIAGIRLGYLFTNQNLVKSLRSFQPYWSLNAIALKVGELLIEEESFVEESERYVRHIREEIFPKLEKMGFILSDSKVNFFLLKDPALENQKSLLVFLLKKGIVARHTENYPFLDGKSLRFAIRPLEEMNQLMEALIEWKAK